MAVLITLFGIFPAAVWSDEGLYAPKLSADKAYARPGWRHFATKRTVLYYQGEADLERLNRKLKGRRRGGFLGLFAGKESGSTMESLGRKVDYLFENAQDLLDMHNCKSRIKIMLYTYQNELNGVYADLTSQYNLSASDTDHIAFYFHKLKTVYISPENVTHGVLAHELAHAIIDHYFIIRPPSKVAEILAQYVDKHLNRR